MTQTQNVGIHGCFLHLHQALDISDPVLNKIDVDVKLCIGKMPPDCFLFQTGSFQFDLKCTIINRFADSC